MQYWVVDDACGRCHWGLFCGAPYGATRRYTECGGRMWSPPLGPAWGGAPYGATKSRTGCGGRMWPPPLGPW
eukprot:2016099-Pyramimonas_sp.AAC.1